MRVFTATLLVVLLAPAGVFARNALSLRVAAQSLADSLRELGSQAHVNVIFDAAQVKGRKARALYGQYDLKHAFASLLKGSGLFADFTGATTVVIKPLPPRPPSHAVEAADNGHDQLQTITVSALVEQLTATRADMPLKEIPQSVSIISQTTFDQQNATNITSALKYATGLSLVQNNSEDAAIYSRGFLVDSVHIDGGAPITVNLGGAGVTSMDIAEFDGIEVLRGSDALFGGMGNPGATISLHRKEPTATDQAEFQESAGSWGNYRVVGDVSGPLNSSGSLSGRLVVAGQDQHYFYNIAALRKRMVYGVLKYELGSSTTIEVGSSYNVQRDISNFEGLPWYDNGAAPQLPRSLAITAAWARGKNSFTEFFGKIDHHFNKLWRLRIDATQLNQVTPEDTTAEFSGPISSATSLLPTSISAGTDHGSNKQTMLDAILTGAFSLLGQEQELMIGADYQHQLVSDSGTNLFPSGPLVDPFAFDPSLYPPPNLSPANTLDTVYTGITITQWGIYGAFRFHPTANLALTAGTRLSTFRSNQFVGTTVFGQAFPPNINNYQDKNKSTPYVGITYDLGPHYTLYASYADIYFTSNGEQTKQHKQLAPADGVNIEGGVKAEWFDNSLNATLSVFKVDQSGIGIPDPTMPPNYSCCFLPASINSKGFEAELTGSITDHWNVTAGYTYDEHVARTAYFVSSLPKNIFKLWTNYQLPDAWSRVSVGGGLLFDTANRVSECVGYNPDGSCAQFVPFQQGSYITAAIRAAYKFNKHLSASVSINNVFDRKYYQTMGQLEFGNWYGSPRNFLIKVEEKF